MKNLNSHSNILLNLTLASLFTFMSMGCSDTQVAGGSTTTENGIVAGTVTNSQGQIKAQSKVSLLPNNFDPLLDSDSLIQISETDSTGYFEFEVALTEIEDNIEKNQAEYTILVEGNTEAALLSSITSSTEGYQITTGQYSVLTIFTTQIDTLRLIGTPYLGIRVDSSIHFDLLAPGTYDVLLSNLSNPDYTQVLVLEPGDTISLNDQAEPVIVIEPIDSIPPIITDTSLIPDTTVTATFPVNYVPIDPSWVELYTHSNKIYSLAYESSTWWVGTESQGIWSSTFLSLFVQNGSAQTAQNREAILDFKLWTQDLNRNMVMYGDQHCYVYINSVYAEVGITFLESHFGDPCLFSHIDSEGQIYLGFNNVIEKRNTSGGWTEILLDEVLGVTSHAYGSWAWNTQSEIIQLSDLSVISLPTEFEASSQGQISSMVKTNEGFYFTTASAIHFFDGVNYTEIAQIESARELMVNPQGQITGLSGTTDFFIFDNQELTVFQNINLSNSSGTLKMTQVGTQFYFTQGEFDLVEVTIPPSLQ